MSLAATTLVRCGPLDLQQIDNRLKGCACLPSLASIENALKELLNADQRYTSQIAEIFRRENAFNVDLNRDALRLQSPESKILWDYSVKTSPEFGFNLHDQNNYYGAGRSGNTAYAGNT